MDDPWGSPWATADGDRTASIGPLPTLVRDPTSPGPLPSPKYSPQLPPVVSSHSPWADEEDTFGEWASPQAPVTQASPRWAPWVGETVPGLEVQLPQDQNNRSIKAGGPPIWLDLVVSDIEDGPEARRSASPPTQDPWATEVSQPKPVLERRELHREAEGNAHSANPPTTTFPTSRRDDPIESSTSEDEPGLQGIEAQELGSHTIRVGTSEARYGMGACREEAAQEHEQSGDGGRAIPEGHSSGVASRRESHASESQPIRERQDSPTTSIDEEAKVRPSNVQRKVSAKLQGLVDMYDGLSAPSEPETIELFASHTTEAKARGSPSTVDVHPQRDEKPLTLLSEDNTGLSAVKSDFPHFVVPLADIAKFYEMTSADAAQTTGGESRLDDGGPVASHFEPFDRIPADSFSTISERKTWYRVSRQGSTRRYNADDESYRRVAWPKSFIRADVLKIVRRWMEEDSIAGRSALGGTGGKSSMFGWDSKAEPIALDRVFGKKPPGHSRSTSLDPRIQQAPVSWRHGRQGSGEMRSPVQRPSSMFTDAVANFGWASEYQAAEEALPPVIPERKPVITDRMRGSLTGPETLVNSNPAREQSVVLQPTNIMESLDADDDEWGEMVTSSSDNKPANGGLSADENISPSDLPTVSTEQISRSDQHNNIRLSATSTTSEGKGKMQSSDTSLIPFQTSRTCSGNTSSRGLALNSVGTVGANCTQSIHIVLQCQESCKVCF